ncbi:uncharacterized protein LOC130184300 isoform X2 [Seriola aureovittata]|uniref:uncharacterized protein LOC130184300 isoform X2 n=1 Tax=Seriola aureovittata TaxID=2871759 RepID=UPI0024BE7DAA|nr:uncharacterized protein LOC130184300 isoform X2 [Seriola aureovittata]
MEMQKRPLTPEEDALEHIVACRDKPFLEERFIDSFKGRGLFTHKTVEPSTFVVEYRGNIFCHKDTRPREECGDTLNNYLYEFSWKGANWCIDASEEDGSLGRLVNDDHISPNCEMRKVVCEGKPHLCLFAVKEISPGEEITYNYGDSSYLWRSRESFGGSSSSNTDFFATSSTPWNERLEDSGASSSEQSCSDDNDDDDEDEEVPNSGPSHDSDSFTNTNSQLDFRDSPSFTEFDSSQEPSGSFMLQPDDASCSQQEDEAALDSDEQGADEDYTPSEPKKTSFTNKNYCYVCGKGISKFARHLFKHADEEPDIAEAFALPKFSKERKRLLDRLRNKGNYNHNQEVLKNNSGELKVRRRQTTVATSAKTCVHCLYCKGMFNRKNMWKHVSRCTSRKMLNPETPGKTRVLSEIALAESRFSQQLPSGVWNMFSTMKHDQISFVVQNDYLLIQLAQYLTEKYGNNLNKHEYIRQKLREMGRLLLALHEKSIFNFEDAIKPQNFYKVVETVKGIAGFDEKNQGYDKPSLALKIGHSLKKLCRIALSVTDDNERTRDTKTFMTLCTKEWSELVSQTAVASLSGRRVNSPSTIPFTRDMQTFYRYLEAASASATDSLKMHESPQVYRALCRVTLAQVSVLNKGAPEVSKMTLKSFQERDDAAQVLSKHFIRINILSKTGQNVAVLLTSDLVSALTLLISKRMTCGVHEGNPFLFAKPDFSASSLYHGGHCIRAFSSLCRAKNPEHLRSVHLQKHIARVFQILNLENDELDHLAKLLGHNIRADRDYYRLPEAAVELAKISKLLLAMEKGSLERFKGNSLDEIDIEDELEPDVEQGNPKNSDAEEDNKESAVLLQQNDDVKQRGRQLSPEQEALEHIKSCRDKPFLQEMFIDSLKGRGVFTHESIEPSTFVVEYRGNIFTHKETRTKKSGYTLNNYLFDFSWNGTNWRIDASSEDGSLGRLVNDDYKSPNCEMRTVVCEGKPHLCLFAVKKIFRGDEITYNYGDSSYPWRSTVVPDDGPSNSFTGINNRQCQNVKTNPESGSSKRRRSVPEPINDGDEDDDDSSNQQEDEADSSSDVSASDVEPKDPSCTTKNYCYVCGKAQSKISRHLFTHRKEEAEIAEVLALRRKSKARKKLLQKLRNRGNYKHNQEVLKTQCGELKVNRRKSNMPPTAKTFAPCIYCKGMYGRKEMWRHMRRCPSKKFSPPTGRKTKILTLVAASVSADPQEIPSEVRKLLKTLKKDEVSSVVWSDSYILQLAQCLCLMNEKKERAEDIKQRLRLMGRLLIILRKKSVSSFEDAIKTENFSKVVEAVRELAGFNEETKSCDRPSVVVRLGNSLKKMSDIRYARALKEEADKETIQDAETFMKLCAEEWSHTPSTISKINSPPTVPFTQDVQLFYQCMEKTATSAVKSLTMYESAPVYNALLRVTVAQVLILNRNVFEVSKVTLQSFQDREETELHGDAAVCQSQFEQILSKRNVKINVITKSGRKNVEKKVAVTLTPELLSAITLLVTKRKACGVHERNPFLFARPVAICTSFYQGQTCISTFAARCGAKKPENLRSTFFRKHIARIFQILSFTNDELDQLARVLGRDIRTDREHYQTPEAALDIAKISELLLAMEYGSLERFEGKSFEEIEISDEVQPYVELNNCDDADDPEEDDEDAGGSLQPSGSFSSTKKRVSSSRKRGRGRRKKSESEESELNKEKSDEDNTENNIKTPEETPSRGFSDNDDDQDMNVDFDMDIDSDEDVRNVENDGDGDSSASAAMPVRTDVNKTTKQDHKKQTTDTDCEDTMDIDAEKHVEKKDKEKEKKNRLLAAVTGMKEVKIVIPKLSMNLQTPVHISQLSSLCNKWPVRDQPDQDGSNQSETSSRSTDAKNKAVHMTCSHCNKSMMMGQTAYQKKGFTDVFCSKNCLFEMFPINKPNTKTCHYCHKAITQPLDLIMAVVDIKGTMKDFCSLTCVSSFKTNSVPTQPPQSLCSMCNKSCTTTCELTLQEGVHKFCSDSCLEGFCRDNMPTCDNCSSLCHNQPLMLELEEETKAICSEKCLQEFKEKIKTPHQCTMCHTNRPMSDMVDYESSKGVVELFCTRTCVTSYKLRPAIIYKLQGKKSSGRLKKRKKEKQSQQKSNTEDVMVSSDSTVNENEASKGAESDATPTLIIADLCVVCCNCGKRLPRGQTLYQPKSSLEVFCSASCLSERHPHFKMVTKNCYNCCQVIMRPHNVILAPVDDSGAMKELCSETCLSSVQSKRDMATPKPPPLVGPRSECRMCARFCYCKFKLTLDGVVHKLCSDTCFINYHKVNNLPVSTCDVCSSICADRRYMLKMEDGSKTICSEECLVTCKEKVRTPQLCPTCQTSHQLSDMVENKNEEGRLDFFCSNRCMIVYKAPSFTVTEKINPSSEESDIKDVKPSLPNLDCIKEEPIDEEYDQVLPPSIFAEDIKDEPNVAKEDLKIDSVFSLTTDSTSAPPTVTHMDLHASCSNCKKVLMDGETVYQRKGHADIFCSTSCLLKFYQMKPVKKTCQFCLQLMTQSQHVLQAPVDNEGTMKDFCSQTCLSSFNYKKIMSTKIPILPVSSHSQCSMCSRYCISKHEIVQQDVVHKVCSDPCFLRFCNMNKLAICVNCHSHCNTPLMLRMEDGNKKLCSGECLTQLKKKIKTPQLCAMCHSSNLISDMVENRNSEDVVELFCTSSCVMASKIQAVSAAGTPLNCDNCGKTTVPACHLAMSDASIRNFCTLACAMAFKETQKDTTAATNPTGASDQTQCDYLKPPDKLPCAQCRRIIKTTPKVVQKKCKMNFVCSLACSQEFKRINSIMGKCEYCKYERIIRDAKRVNDKDCYFCSDGCKMLFRHDLEQEWGKHCRSCAYCHSISRAVVTAKYDGKDEEFCSEDCSANYNMLFCRVAKCDTCSRNGKLRQSLPMLGEVKHFCDLKCLLHFCNKKLQMVNTVSSPPRFSGTAESSPVIANVISLAGTLAQQTSACSSTEQPASVPDIQTKVIGHASIQTIPKEVKNKSMLCTPLVHNKGVSCTTQTIDTEAQTDNFLPKVIVLPVPVPVYVPLPMNMYSQFTPKPVGLPLPLPVPVFLPEPTMKERMEPEPSEGKLNVRSEMETEQDEWQERENGQEAGEVTREEDRQETEALKDHTSSCRQDLVEEDLDSFSSQEDSTSPPLSPAPPPPPPPDTREDPQSSPRPAPAAPLLQQTPGKVHNQNKLLQLSKETSQRDCSKVMSRKHHKLKSQCGTDAWKRWIQWRESQTNLDPVSSHVRLKEDVLHCSAAELSDGLCRFVSEVKQPDGEPYSPDGLFYLCLSIQLYLFENGRMENIFSDLIYNKFCTDFTKILKTSVTASGSIHSRVEEEFLWDCKQLGAYSPIVLLNTMLFFCCKYFGFTTVEQHRQLSFAHVMRCTKTNPNNTKTTFLRFYPPLSIHEAEPDTDGVPAKRRKKNQNIENFLEMMENTENPLRCPVRLYEFYLSKCSESVRQHSDLFYLHPDHRCVPSSPLWFSSSPLDDSTMEAMIVRILTVRELQGDDVR